MLLDMGRYLFQRGEPNVTALARVRHQLVQNVHPVMAANDRRMAGQGENPAAVDHAVQLALPDAGDLVRIVELRHGDGRLEEQHPTHRGG